jgi:hypothetical protein
MNPRITHYTLATGILLIFLFVMAASVRAQGLAQQPCYSSRGGYCLKIVAPKNYRSSAYNSIGPGFAATAAGIPGLEFLGESANLGDLLANLYYFLLSLVGIAALVKFVEGGIRYMIARDDSSQTGKARELMKNAVLGLVLALTSYIILWTINPDLVNRLDINLAPIAAPPKQTDGGPQTGTVDHGGVCSAGFECKEENDDCLVFNADACFGVSGNNTGRCLNDTDPECKSQ